MRAELLAPTSSQVIIGSPRVSRERRGLQNWRLALGGRPLIDLAKMQFIWAVHGVSRVVG